MTGTIVRVLGNKQSCCYIQSGSETVWAHRMDFAVPAHMTVGREVEFRKKLASIPGKPHPVTDVVSVE